MSKDWFNGKIKEEHIKITKFSLVFGSSIFFICATFLLVIAILYQNVDSDITRIKIFIIAGFAYLCSILLPFLSLISIRSYPKHKKLAHLFIKKECFKEYE